MILFLPQDIVPMDIGEKSGWYGAGYFDSNDFPELIPYAKFTSKDWKRSSRYKFPESPQKRDIIMETTGFIRPRQKNHVSPDPGGRVS